MKRFSDQPVGTEQFYGYIKGIEYIRASDEERYQVVAKFEYNDTTTTFAVDDPGLLTLLLEYLRNNCRKVIWDDWEYPYIKLNIERVANGWRINPQ